MHFPLRFLTAFVIAAAAVVALPATASADSIVYVKDGNVWLTSPDAAKQYQVTFDGGYSSPSQADDGTIVALRARQFVRMDRSGHQLNAPIDAIGTSGGNFYGPYEPRVSPDGTRIAYWFGQYSSYYSYGCSCYLFHLESKTAWSYADRFTDPTAESENYLGLEQFEWLTNDRLLASYPGFWMSGWTFKLGTGDSSGCPVVVPVQGRPGLQLLPHRSGAQPGRQEARARQRRRPQCQEPAPPGRRARARVGGRAALRQRLPRQQRRGAAPAAVLTGEGPRGQPDVVAGLRQRRVRLDRRHPRHRRPRRLELRRAGRPPLARGGAEPDWGPADVNLAQRPSPPAAAEPAGAVKPAVRKAGPGLARVRLTPASFRARAGARLRFSLAGPAKLTLVVTRASGKAVKGSIRTAGKPGANTLRFKGRIGGHALRPGRYRLTITARAMAGGARAKATTAFRIVR